ncbi:ExeA family protein [Ramlibacter sp. WS9]|uniref:ExeA family protein n=1 Tax=Ramlibacter sp. WS9 TaxID=1882741 RepID=UPI001143F003|nr:AAA family ATPase [Ramlibacter sp. WS9]ROZ68585.1 AAA family ATPase [Ramlibacter sp. WS9]
MYLRHFGLREFPFSITPDTSFFFSSAGSQEALNTLLVAARMGEGFIKITGEVGTGKTLLCRKLMSSLGRDFCVAYIPNPYLEPISLFMELASELGIELEPGANFNQHHLLRRLTLRLVELTGQGKRVVICLDEAQAMPIETLEALRLLTNLETEKRKLLQVIIFGQPELEDKLNHPSIRQLKQRITFDYHLAPLTGSELDYYLHHRLVVAGFKGGRLFDSSATWLLERRTRRIPRLVNIVAHKSLLSAYGKGKRRVGFFDVLAATNDTASLEGNGTSGMRGVLLVLLLGSCLATLGWVSL